MALPMSETNLTNSNQTITSLRRCLMRWDFSVLLATSTSSVTSCNLRTLTAVTVVSTRANASWKYSADSVKSTLRVPFGSRPMRSREQTSSIQSAPKLAAMRRYSRKRIIECFWSAASLKSSKCLIQRQNLKKRRAMLVILDRSFRCLLVAAGTISEYAPTRRMYCKILRPFSRTWALLANLFAVEISRLVSVSGICNHEALDGCVSQYLSIFFRLFTPPSKTAVVTRTVNITITFVRARPTLMRAARMRTSKDSTRLEDAVTFVDMLAFCSAAVAATATLICLSSFN
mmetsp:Transcript_36697/g.68632  ORF Transcript_36697/g.68632 Transcript_36697/m.68632 type:complete len:288 (-) Transcript_36697:502-1365(-)